MTINTSAALTAGLLAVLILAGSLVPVHADSGSGQAQPGPRTAAAWSPLPPAFA